MSIVLLCCPEKDYRLTLPERKFNVVPYNKPEVRNSDSNSDSVVSQEAKKVMNKLMRWRHCNSFHVSLRI